MSTTTYSSFRRRTIGRAASPPTWACYEQIPYDDEDSDSVSDDMSCSEDGEDYGTHGGAGDGPQAGHVVDTRDAHHDHGDTQTMEIDEEGHRGDEKAGFQRDLKGKQRAIEPEPESSPSKQRRPRQRQRQPVYALRPILTIHKSQGFVWNQDLFVPPYIKDRYVASTSPPNAPGFVSTSASSTNSSLTDYDTVEVVEIRVKEGELNDIIP
ncbi:hypothetical protein PLICRDRAFT_39851 [Plicaturopsis crispa FD-325 SS-3]|nr:hypothetical protein PLICRDRAFT_39851 [Plicaturopsis crispa FD-325 SS-3]